VDDDRGAPGPLDVVVLLCPLEAVAAHVDRVSVGVVAPADRYDVWDAVGPYCRDPAESALTL
jgi:hypothetical protein